MTGLLKSIQKCVGICKELSLIIQSYRALVVPRAHRTALLRLTRGGVESPAPVPQGKPSGYVHPAPSNTLVAHLLCLQSKAAWKMHSISDARAEELHDQEFLNEFNFWNQQKLVQYSWQTLACIKQSSNHLKGGVYIKHKTA